MSCILENRVSHAKAKEQFRKAEFFCPLFDKKSVGMSSFGTICGHCCLRIQHINECIMDLLIRQTIRYEDLELNPQCFVEYLPDNLREYIDCVRELSGKEWIEIKEVCKYCHPQPLHPEKAPKAEPTRMTNVAKRDV